MRYAQNNDVYESTTQCATDWSSINWYKVEKYVDKLQKRIYHAESIMTELSDKVLLEPYVWKRTRTVLKRVRTSNRPILSNASPHPHKKNIDTNPLNVQFIPGLKKPENSCTIKLNYLSYF